MELWLLRNAKAGYYIVFYLFINKGEKMSLRRREMSFSKGRLQHKTTPQRGTWGIREYFLSLLTLFLPSDFLLGLSSGQIIGKPQ